MLFFVFIVILLLTSCNTELERNVMLSKYIIENPNSLIEPDKDSILCKYPQYQFKLSKIKIHSGLNYLNEQFKNGFNLIDEEYYEIENSVAGFKKTQIKTIKYQNILFKSNNSDSLIVFSYLKEKSWNIRSIRKDNRYQHPSKRKKRTRPHDNPSVHRK